MADCAAPWEARVVGKREEAPDIVTLSLRLSDPDVARTFSFSPGQFNMVYLFGVGQVPLSLSSDPDCADGFDHTVRRLGRVTQGLAGLSSGDAVGVRGPFGKGWPVREAVGRDVLVVTGGLGCAQVVSLIRYLMSRRESYGHIWILQGVRHANDLIWRDQYSAWAGVANTEVRLAADLPAAEWRGHRGLVTELLTVVDVDPRSCVVMLGGPELMMLEAVALLRERGIDDSDIWLSLERNMQCGDGRCGYCQFGPWFVCRDGPVFRYAEIADFFGAKGY